MRLHKKHHDIDMLSGAIMPKLLRFSIPLILSSILQLTFNAADVIVVGRFEGDNALAAVGAPGALINLLINLFVGLSVGANVVVAQCYGAGNYVETKKAVHTATGLSIISGIGVGIFGFFTAGVLLQLMDTPPEVLPLATTYMRIYFLGMPANMLYNFGAAILRAVGDTKRPLTYLTVAGVVNVVLNLVFVIAFGMGVKGVALATIISQFISAALIVICLMRSEGSIKLSPRQIRFERDKMVRIAKVGLPAGLQGCVFSLSNVLIQSTVNGFGAIVVAGNTAASNLESYVYAAMNSIYQAAITFTGQNVGAGKYDRISKVTRSSLITVVGIGAIMGGLLMGFLEPLLGIYTQDPMVIAAGKIRSTYVVPLYFLCGMMDVMVGVLRGMGNSVTPMIVSILGACGLRVLWIYTIVPLNHTLQTLYISYPVSWAITLTVHCICYFVIKRKFITPEKAF